MTAVGKDLLKILEAEDLNRLGFEQEHIQCLLKSAMTENEVGNFVSLRQAALYTALYWGYEVKDVEPHIKS